MTPYRPNPTSPVPPAAEESTSLPAVNPSGATDAGDTYRPRARTLLMLSAVWLAFWWLAGCASVIPDPWNPWLEKGCTYSYSAWSICADGKQTRVVEATTPEGCTGTPVLEQACETPEPTEPATTGDALDPSLVTWDEPAGDLSAWEANVTLSNVRAEGGKFSWEQSGATWKSEQKSGWDRPAIGNVLVIAQCNGAWHGAAWDWIGPGVRQKELPDFATANGMHGPCLEAWVPASGEKVCWMLSSFARGHLDLTVKQRSTIACTVWP